MAALPENNTARLYLDYITQSTGFEHTCIVRYNGSDPNATDAQAGFLSVLNAIGVGAFRSGWRFLRARVALAGSDFSLPVALSSGLAAFVGTSATALNRQDEARRLSWQGRSPTTGRRCSFTLFGIIQTIPSDYRLSVGEAAYVGPSITALNALPDTAMSAIDNTEVQWYSYVNVGLSAYWQRRLRIS